MEKQKNNVLLSILIIIFLIGYTVFFTSRLWMGTSGELIDPTKFYISQTADDRDITLYRWNYSQKQKLMEIDVEIINNSLNTDSEYEFSATDRNKGKIDSKISYSNDNFFSLRLTDVPRDWSEISLKISKADSQDVLIKLYTNKESCKEITEIDELNGNEYMIRHFNDIKEFLQLQIDEENNQIISNNEEISGINKQIKKYKDDESYQTNKEKETTNQKISSLENSIKTLNEKNDLANQNIKEYQNRIINLDKRKMEYE